MTSARTPESSPPLELEEEALVAAMMAGDAEAMDTFADGYLPIVFRFALARLHGRRELAREMVQRTMVKALEKLGSYRGEAPLGAWLCVVCRNEIGMYFRREQRGPRAVELDAPGAGLDPSEVAGGPPPGAAPAPDREVLVRERRRQVHETLDLLPPRYARALEWKYVHRLPVRDIADRLGISPKAAESLLTRARDNFRGRFATVDAGWPTAPRRTGP